MTDPLDRLAAAAGPLLRRVDTVLAQEGAAAGDPVWPLVRRVGALPSGAVTAVAGWHAAPLGAAAGPLRALAREYAGTVDSVPGQVAWEGASAEAYGRQWRALRAHLVGPGTESVAARFDHTAAYLDATAEWVTRSRLALARALADVLGSAEAVALETGLEPAGPAAARVAVHVLAPVAASCDEGWKLHDDWDARLAQLPYQPPSAAPASGRGVVRLGD